MFWALGAKQGGVPAFRVVSISRAVARCKVARLKPSKLQESYAKGSQKKLFLLGFQKQRYTFSGHFWDVLGFGREIRWCFGVSSGVHQYRAVARCKVARLKPSKQQESYAKGSQFFSRVSKATLGTFSGHFWDVLGAK